MVQAMSYMHRYARVKHKPRNVGILIAPDTITLQDKPFGKRKGDRIPLLEQWYNFCAKINSPQSLRWLLKKGSAWRNVHDMVVEHITFGGNVIHIDSISNGYGRLRAFAHTDFPLVEYSYNDYPEYIHKVTCIRRITNRLYKPGAGLDVYFPLIKKTEHWIKLDKVELFPELPLPVTVTTYGGLIVRPTAARDGYVAGNKAYLSGTVVTIYEYKPRGENVWGRTDDGWIALLWHGNYYTTWRMETQPPL